MASTPCYMVCCARLAHVRPALLSGNHVCWSLHAFRAWLIGSNTILRCFPRVLHPVLASFGWPGCRDAFWFYRTE